MSIYENNNCKKCQMVANLNYQLRSQSKIVKKQNKLIYHMRKLMGMIVKFGPIHELYRRN